MEKINKLSLPVTILIASIILGGFYYVSQLSRQKSIEAQQLKEAQKQRDKELILDICLSDATKTSKTNSDNLINNSVGTQFSSLQRLLDENKASFNRDREECFKRYN